MPKTGADQFTAYATPRGGRRLTAYSFGQEAGSGQYERDSSIPMRMKCHYGQSAQFARYQTAIHLSCPLVKQHNHPAHVRHKPANSQASRGRRSLQRPEGEYIRTFNRSSTPSYSRIAPQVLMDIRTAFLPTRRTGRYTRNPRTSTHWRRMQILVRIMRQSAVRLRGWSWSRRRTPSGG
jgi:hypothetical protein